MEESGVTQVIFIVYNSAFSRYAFLLDKKFIKLQCDYMHAYTPMYSKTSALHACMHLVPQLTALPGPMNFVLNIFLTTCQHI